VNIICNNCIGAMIYEKKGEEFSNPFMWCLIPQEDFITLINEFNNINFENITVKNNIVLIDNKVNVFYTHYKYGDYQSPTKIGSDVYVNDVEKYVREKYLKRLKRMLDKKESPVFIISDRKNGYGKYVFEDFSLLKNIHNCHNCILITDKKNIKNQKMRTIYVNDSNAAVSALADFVMKEIKL